MLTFFVFNWKYRFWLSLAEKESKLWFGAYGVFEASSSVHVGERTAGEFNFCFSRFFLVGLAECMLWQGEWALGYDFMEYRHFLIFPNF